MTETESHKYVTNVKKNNQNIIYQPTASFPFQLLLSGVSIAYHLNLSPVSTSLTQNLLHVKAENCYINILHQSLMQYDQYASFFPSYSLCPGFKGVFLCYGDRIDA